MCIICVHIWFIGTVMEKISFGTECQRCPGGTEPSLGYEYKWWNILPRNMKTSCFNVGNSKCDEMNGKCKNKLCIFILYMYVIYKYVFLLKILNIYIYSSVAI